MSRPRADRPVRLGPAARTLAARTLAALTLAIGATACGGGDDVATPASSTAPVTAPVETSDSSPASTATTGAPDPEPTAAAPVPEFLDFTADDVRGGDTIDASVYAGTDLVLWFWAPW